MVATFERREDESDTPQATAEALEVARAEGILKGLQEAAFICEGHAASLAEGNDHHAEYNAVNTCFDLIDQRIQEKAGQL